jgi:hypothetical protein|tara:strand:+ start:163 stop:420 length:258 start_codon:yes stop_codon:yes gene_type:complete
MNAKERGQITELAILVGEIRKDNIQILSILRDDPNSNSVGLITKVNNLDKQVGQLVSMSKNIKKISAIVSVLLTPMIGYFVKEMF